MADITIRIVNFEKYKGRPEVKMNSWFRFSNRFLEDHEFFDFSFEEKFVWVYLLSISSQRNEAVIHVSLQHAHHIARLSPPAVTTAINKLKKIGCIEVSRARNARGRYADVSLACSTLQDKTLQDTTGQDTNTRAAALRAEFDFEAFYLRYPRKIGKSAGIRKLKSQICGATEGKDLCTALDNYLAHLKLENTETRYVKHFSTWVNSWRDWLDPATGSGKNFGAGAARKAEIESELEAIFNQVDK